MTTRTPAEVAATYFDAWKRRDFAAFRSLLADDVVFDGPLAHVEGADACVAGIAGMARMLEDIVIHKVFVDGADVVTWFDLHLTGIAPMPTANWSHIEDGRITRIRVAFDPRPIFAKQG